MLSCTGVMGDAPPNPAGDADADVNVDSDADADTDTDADADTDSDIDADGDVDGDVDGDGDADGDGDGDGDTPPVECDPSTCGADRACCPGSTECVFINTNDRCGSCGNACPADQRCVGGTAGAFCTACDPDACAVFGVSCCPDDAPYGGCTDIFVDPNNCGGCGGSCAADELCNAGVCEDVGLVRDCDFDPMQWWRSPESHETRDITFVAFGDTHASDPNPVCRRSGSYAVDQNYLMAEAVNSTLPSIFWDAHVWPAGSSFYRESEPFDHVRGVVIAGDLTNTGSESIPAGALVCREYLAYRDAFGRCGDEGRLQFPVYDLYGNHDFPRSASPGDVSYHPVIDHLDRITAAHRPGAASSLYDDPSGGTGHYAWRWDDIWFVNVNVKPGNELEYLPGDDNMRIVDPHGSRGFFTDFLSSRANNRHRQIVVVAHYPLWSGRISHDEKESFCRRIHNAQNGTGSFSGRKLSRENPIVAYVHGHNHHVPEYRTWTCPSPYDDITIPHFSVGTPAYASDRHDGDLHFTIFRLGSHRLEVVGVSAPAADPTGPWTYLYAERLGIMNAP